MRRPRRAPLAGRRTQVAGALLCLALLAPATAAADAAAAAREAAEGHRRFLARDFAGAMAAYARAWREAPGNPTLAYNAGTAAHRAGRLPEAVLWYRRADRAGRAGANGRDPWLEDNLALARRALGSQEAAEPPGSERWRESGRWIALAGVLLAWAVPALLAFPHLRRPGRPGVAGAAALAAAALFAAGLALDSRAPRPGVLLAECRGLPAGSEVWVRPTGWDGRAWRVLGESGGVCPAGAVSPVE
jgi:tetratricopeptide (TPR) repeat protein